jgi:hypothetical protein
MLRNLTYAADVDLARITVDLLNDLAALELYQEKYESLTARYKQCCIEANQHLGYRVGRGRGTAPLIDRLLPSYHSAYSEVSYFYNSPTLNDTEIKIK